MRRPPPLRLIPHFPATAGTAILALIATLAGWFGADLSRVIADAHLAHGQLWRLITCALPHRDPFHLAFNLYWLWVFGTLIEAYFGAAKTFALYGLLALVSAAAEYAMLDGGVGLSGIVFGLFAMLMILTHRRPRDARFDGAVDERTVHLFAAWFFLGIVTTITGLLPVANLAHLFGAAIGALVALAMKARKRVWIPASLATLLICFATFARPYLNCSAHRGEEQAYLGYEALNRNSNDEAAWWLSDATIMRPDDGRNWFNLAIARSKLKNYPLALIAYTRAAESDPENMTYRQARDQMRAYVMAIQTASAN